MNKIEKKIIAVDVDGLLCEGDAWTLEECQSARPIKKNIEKVNKLYLTNFIVIFTARRDFLIFATLLWLRKNGVMYHAFSNRKMPADYYIDDRFLNI